MAKKFNIRMDMEQEKILNTLLEALDLTKQEDIKERKYFDALTDFLNQQIRDLSFDIGKKLVDNHISSRN